MVLTIFESTPIIFAVNLSKCIDMLFYDLRCVKGAWGVGETQVFSAFPWHTMAMDGCPERGRSPNPVAKRKPIWFGGPERAGATDLFGKRKIASF